MIHGAKLPKHWGAGNGAIIQVKLCVGRLAVGVEVHGEPGWARGRYWRSLRRARVTSIRLYLWFWVLTWSAR